MHYTKIYIPITEKNPFADVTAAKERLETKQESERLDPEISRELFQLRQELKKSLLPSDNNIYPAFYSKDITTPVEKAHKEIEFLKAEIAKRKENE